jgi:hypothetical protein
MILNIIKQKIMNFQDIFTGLFSTLNNENKCKKNIILFRNKKKRLFKLNDEIN